MINKKIILLSFLLVTLLFISGCGTINIRMDLKSDWTYDWSMEVKGNEMLVNIVKNAMSTAEYKDRVKEIEIEGGVLYKFTDSLAGSKEVPTQEQSPVSYWGVKKNFKFPFYYYTLTLKNKGMEQESYNEEMLGGAFGFNFILHPYGKITETNGVLLGEKEDSVRFDLTKTQDYYVTFRKFFILDLFTYSKVKEREAQEQTTNLESTEGLGGVTGEQEETKEYSSEELQYLEVSCSSPGNWDSDADDDGITLSVAPTTKDGSIIPIEGEITVNAYVLERDEDTWKYYKGGLVNTRYVPDIEGKDRLEYFDDYSGYRIMLKWDDTKPYSSTKEDYGIVYVKFVTKDGKSFEAKTGDDYPSCQIRPSSN